MKKFFTKLRWNKTDTSISDTTTYPKFIPKDPCGEDLFTGKSHEKTARQIADFLTVSKKSVMVGIDGGWGAGKSNLIIQIKDKLKEKPILFFKYDVWGHQEDLARRSILEELTEFVSTPQKGCKKTALKEKAQKGWKEKLKSLLSQRREISTQNIPKISSSILVISLILISTPILHSIADVIPSTPQTNYLKPLITALPLISFLLYIPSTWLYKKIHKHKKISFTEILDSFFYLYQNRVKEETTYEEVFFSEPSSKQFKKWMHALDEDLQTTLVIVFDNMDRLPSSKIQEFWAAIHSFFSEETYTNIRVVVPFDRSNIISAFRSENTDETTSNTQESRKYYGNDFIDKTFDVVYRVAPPILSDWKKYLALKWEEAFGKRLSPESPITQIYDLLAQGTTPREIIAFINECVSIKQICHESIPEEYIALFVVGKHQITENALTELLELKFCGALSYQYANEKTSEYLSALYYQLDPEKAMDVVYTDLLRKQLNKGDSTLLQTLISKSIFNELLEKAIAGVKSVKGATEAFIKVEEEHSIPTHFWDQLLQKLSGESNLPEDFQIALLKHTSKDKAKGHLSKVIHSIYQECQETTDTTGTTVKKIFDAPKFFELINKLLVELSNCKELDPLSFLHEETTSPENYILFVELASSEHKKFRIKCPAENIDQYLSKLPIKKKISLSVIPLLDTTKLTLYSQALREHLKGYIYDLDISRIESLFNKLLEIKKFIGLLWDENKIQTYFSQTGENSPLYYCLICMRIAKGRYFPYWKINKILSQENSELATSIAKYMDFFIHYEDLLLMYNEMGSYPLYIQTAHYMIQNHGAGNTQKLSVSKVLPSYKEIATTFNVTLEELFSNWSKCNPDFKTSINTSIISSIPIQFFKDTREYKENILVEHCDKIAIKYLHEILPSKWERAFIKQNKDYELLIILQADIPRAYETFKSSIQEELEKGKILLSDKVWNNLSSLFGNKEKHWETISLNLERRYMEERRYMSKELFQRYGKLQEK